MKKEKRYKVDLISSIHKNGERPQSSERQKEGKKTKRWQQFPYLHSPSRPLSPSSPPPQTHRPLSPPLSPSPNPLALTGYPLSSLPSLNPQPNYYYYYYFKNNFFILFLSLSQYGSFHIRCVRVGGVEIPNNKRVEFSLQYIHGIGRSRSRQILCDLNLENKVAKELSDEELISLRDEVSKYMIEGDLVCFLSLLLFFIASSSINSNKPTLKAELLISLGILLTHAQIIS